MTTATETTVPPLRVEQFASGPQVSLLTPEEATNILSQCAFPRQRRVRADWVAELASIIRKGQFATTAITFALCKENNRLYLIDGYHRLNAIVQAELPATILMNLETCPTLEDVGVLYSRLDRGLPRSVADGITARDLTVQTNIALTTLRQGIAAVNVIQGGFRYNGSISNKRGLDDKISAVDEWLPELRAYAAATAGGSRSITKRLLTAPIMAVGLTLFRHQSEKAEAFFSPVASAAGLVPNTGQHTFLTKILQDEDFRIWKTGAAHICRLVANCWNAYFEEKSIKKVVVHDVSRPILLLGTPYTHWKTRK